MVSIRDPRKPLSSGSIYGTNREFYFPYSVGFQWSFDARRIPTKHIINNSVDVWPDALEDGNQFVAASSGQRPVLEEDAINGQPALVFEGISHMYGCAGLRGLFSSGGYLADHSCFIVLAPPTGNEVAGTILAVADPTSTTEYMKFQDASEGSTSVRFSNRDTANGTTNVTTTSQDLANPNCYQWAVQWGVNMRHGRSDVALTNTAIVPTPARPKNFGGYRYGVSLGADSTNSGNTDFWSGKIAFIGFARGVVSDSTFSQMRSWAAGIWGIPLPA